MYSAAMAGKPSTGRVNLFARDYMTHYVPIRNDAGEVAAIASIGIDFTQGLEDLKKQIREIRVGDTGYVFIVEMKDEPGKMVVHPSLEGKDGSGVKTRDGRFIVRDMLEQKNGVAVYAPEDKLLSARDKISVFETYAHWNWLVVSGSYLDEFTHDASTVQRALAFGGLIISRADRPGDLCRHPRLAEETFAGTGQRLCGDFRRRPDSANRCPQPG